MDLKKTPHVYYSFCHYGSILYQTFSKKRLFSGLCSIGNVVFICEILGLYKFTLLHLCVTILLPRMSTITINQYFFFRGILIHLLMDPSPIVGY